MTHIKRIIGLLLAAVALVAPSGAAPASASSAPVVITYEKDCLFGHCAGSAGTGGTFEMQVTSFRPTGKGAVLTMTEWVTVGDISFTAEMTAHSSPAGFIVLNGTVTEGDFLGAQIHQRSNLVGVNGSTTSWVGQLRLMPSS